MILNETQSWNKMTKKNQDFFEKKTHNYNKQKQLKIKPQWIRNKNCFVQWNKKNITCC